MIEMDDKIVSADLLRECFACDLGRCKGICCVEGDAGAPLEIDEVDEIDKEAEFAYLKSYIRGACFDDEISVDYLYSLWIAFCLHHGLTVDKDEYQERMEGLWKALEESDGGEVSHWENYSSFDSDMSRKLQ